MVRRPDTPVTIPALSGIGLIREFSTPEGKLRALDLVSISVQPGEFVSLVGPSGSGKTTLLYCLSGLDRANDGAVAINGRVLYAPDRIIGEDQITAMRAESIGFIFQNYHLLASLTAVENVEVPLRVMGKSRRESRQLALQALDEVDMSHRANHRPAMMSGGEQQRVAVARALVTKPSVILADEPTGNLDYENGARVVRLLADLATKHNAAVIMVSHVMEHARQADRILIMDKGKIVGEERGGTAG